MRGVFCFTVLLLTASLVASSQQLQLTGIDGKSTTITTSDLKAMTHHSVSVVNPHTKAEEKYDGVLLSDLLAKAGAPLGEKLRGKAMLIYVNAGATDNYHAVFSLAEIDPDTHPNEIIVADAMDGKPLDAKQGPLKLVVPGDKRPARSVRMLTTISLNQAQ